MTESSADRHAIGFPGGVAGCLFDLDGVLTRTAAVHAAAWKELFDAFLEQRARTTSGPFVPFDLHRDYDRYVDGKPREDGIRSFLASRDIVLPDGDLHDPAIADTVRALGARKNALFLTHVHRDGVRAYPGSVAYVQAVRSAGIRCAVVSSSTSCAMVLAAAGIEQLFDIRVDGVTAHESHLGGKPAADTYLFAARALGLEPDACVVFEDALAGVEAGRAGGFAAVVGVDRVGQGDALRAHGATIVVADLAELLVQP